MLGYRRKSFERVHAILREIVQSPEDIRRVLACQRILLQEILRAEAHISRHKDEMRATRITLKTSRPDRSEAQRLKRRIRWIQARIEAYWHLIYIWRCFGDGIAFSYLDKHAIKHAFYETESSAIKQDAGFLSGKKGLDGELSVVTAMIEDGVPSILVDVTNSIRHGDVCLLLGPDPYLIEIKSASRINARGRRQIAHIDKLHTFYETDIGVGLRGFPELRRVATDITERRYVDEINVCMDHAERGGFCVANPEAGLYYVAMYKDPGMRTLFESLPVEKPLVLFLNEYKSNQAWSPYFPFTISIKGERHLYDFVRGNLLLLVILDPGILCQHVSLRGFDAQFEHDADFPLQCKDRRTGGKFNVSHHLLLRVALEFLSPESFVELALGVWSSGASAAAPLA